MKNMMKHITLGTFIVAIAISSCTKKIDEAYANPNADVRVPVEQLLPAIISSMAANGAGHGAYNDARFVGKYIQNWQFCNAGDMYDRMCGRLITLGSTQADMTGSIFRAHYFDIGQNLVKMIKWAEEEKKWDYAGVGRAIFAWSWLQMTDVQGEVILKDAFDQSKITFKYDNQDEVYTFARDLALQAVDYLNRTGDNVSQANLALGDAYMFNGDVNKWKKFAYAVLARSYNHLTSKATYKPDSVLYYTNLSMNSVTDNAQVKFAYVVGGFSAAANFYGPLRGNLASVTDGTNSAIRQSNYIANLLTGANAAFPGVVDPRAIYLIRKNTNNTFKGVSPNKGQTALAANDRPENFWGVSQAASVNNAAPSNDANCRFIFRNTSPLPVITAAEVQFMRAEAALRKGDRATALAAYVQGISLHFDHLTTDYNVNIPAGEEITPAKKAAYLADPRVVPTAANLTLTHIMLQKYIAMFGIGVIETWTDMRRYHYADIDPATGQQVYRDFVVPSGTDLHPNNLGNTVQRLYPRYNSETVWNIEELRRIGADRDDFHTKICWFAQP
jgi:hypothetical protein